MVTYPIWNHREYNMKVLSFLYMMMLRTISAQLAGVRTRTKPQQEMMIPPSFIPVKMAPL